MLSFPSRLQHSGRAKQRHGGSGKTDSDWGAGYAEIVKENALFEKYYQVGSARMSARTSDMQRQQRHQSHHVVTA